MSSSCTPDAAHPWLHDTVSALVYSLAQAHAGTDGAEWQPPYNDLTAFVLQQQAQLPDYLRAPMRLALCGFDLLGCLRTGRLFHSHPAAVRARQIAGWKNSTVAFQRDLIRYCESLTAFGLYSRAASPVKPRASAATNTSWPRVLENPAPELRCEIAVVGSGPGGAITACLLAEAGRDVLLIEEGPFLPLEACAPFSLEEMLQKYRHGGQTIALGRDKIAFVEGRCVGGGSEINSGLYHRTPPEVLEQWRKQFDVQGLTEAELPPFFEANERDLSVSLLPGTAPAASLKLHEGAARLGWKSLEVPRWFRHNGSATGGERQSMTRTFVPRFLKANGRLLPHARVTRLREEIPGWRLEARASGGRVIRIAAENVFLCAGAIQTPALLRRSGIKRNIGNSLQVHPTIKITARFAETVNALEMGVPVHQVKEFAPRLSFGCSVSTPAYLALGLLDHPACASELQRTWAQTANYYAMISPEGRGSVRTLPGFNDPLVRYGLTQNDRRNLAEGLRKLSELIFAVGAVRICPGIAGSRCLASPDDLTQLPTQIPSSRTSLMTIHLFSTCPMGEIKSKCAVDSFGQLQGFRNLFVADASVLCGAPGVNPQGTIMALARRNAMHWLGRKS